MRQEAVSEFFGSSLNTKSGILLESIQLKEKESNARLNNLEKKLAEIEIKLTESSAVSDSLLLSCQEIQNKLEKEYDYITDGIILRWYEQGKKSTKYFLSIEKRNKAKSHVRKIFLRDTNDHETENPIGILSEFKFYARKSAKLSKNV